MQKLQNPDTHPASSAAAHGVTLGWWRPGAAAAARLEDAAATALAHVARPVFVVELGGGRLGMATDGDALLASSIESSERPPEALPLRAFAPALRPERLGDAAFRAAHGVRYACVGGAMANGISSVELVEAFARAGMLAFFGAAGLEPSEVESAIDRIQASAGDQPYGFNLIHSPNEPALEDAIVDLYLRRGVTRVCASAFLDLTLPLVRYRVSGVATRPDGSVFAPNRVLGKVSRVEVARKFFSPPPDAMLAELVQRGAISERQARLAARLPIAEDITAEADSGGHTDNRPLVALLPTMLALRDTQQTAHGFATPLRVGVGGGIATPASAAAAFAMGAAYVMTGTINQACVEAGTSPIVKQMLAEAEQADVVMAPAADMFEMGVKVQVLKRGTMFALRARKLYELYRAYNRIEDLPATERSALERDYFRCTLEQAWASTVAFFQTRDPAQITRAERDPKHKLALVFRAYLGQSSNWANRGIADRKVDYQVWCGPAMGAFNEWTRGTFLADPANRDVVTVAHNLLVGAAALTRAAWLRNQGVTLPADAGAFAPRPLDELESLQSA